MPRLLKYLKKSAWAIVAVLLLLVLQAYCDLSLPQYTSDIVNVGIQQGGIEDIAPEKIRAEEMAKLLLFVDEGDQDAIMDNYAKTSANGLELYQLKADTSREDIEAMNQLFAYPMFLVYGLEQGGFSEEGDASADMLKNMAAAGFDSETFNALPQMPAAQREPIVQAIKEGTAELKNLDNSILQQVAVNYVKNEYQACGMDTAKMQSQYIWRTGLTMLGFALLIGICTILVTLLAARVGSFFARDLRRETFKKVVGFSVGDMEQFSSASLITRCTNDVQQVQMMIIMLLRMVFYAPIIGIGAIFMVFHTGSSMTWVIGVAVIAIMTLVILLMVFTMPRFKLLQKLVDKVNLVTREFLTGLPVVRAFSREKYEEERFDKANRKLTKTNLFVNRAMTLMMPTMMFIMNGVAVLIVWVGADVINAGNMQVGDLMAFIQYTMQIIMSFLMLSMMSIMLPRALVSANRIADVLGTENSITDPATPQSFPSQLQGVVEFKNVCFRYPDAEEYVLRDISFTAEAGQTTAFIGSTGSGKSTVANLIPRFFDVTEGQILIDNVDIRSVTCRELRDKIGYVPQKATLFSGTVASNIGYSGVTDKEVIASAAAVAQSTDFIAAMEEGYDSEIAQGGTNVSGGQRQRLSIARAIAKQPEIYLFDDSFSALDYKTDAALRRALAQSTKKSTVLIISQRISTILNADRIVVLDDGEVAGIGTHQELLHTSEVYRQIALSQLSKEELGL